MKQELISNSSSKTNGQEHKTIPGLWEMNIRAEVRIFCPGDKTTNLFYLLEGRVCLSGFPASNFSDKVVTVADLQGPSLLSSVALTKEKAHQVEAKAKTDCRILLIPAEYLPQIARFKPLLFDQICSSLAEQHENLTRNFVFQNTSDFFQKVAYTLLCMSDNNTYQAKQTEIAAHAGLSRESVNKALLLFKKKGWISKRGSSTKNGCVYTIENPEELARLITGQFDTANT